MGGVNAMAMNMVARYRILAVKRGLTLGTLRDASATEFRLLVCSAALAIPKGRPFPEREINEMLCKWLAAAGAMLSIDHVELRRWLADLGLVSRDRAGSRYSRGEFNAEYADIAREIAGINLGQVASGAIDAEEARRAQRKASWQARQKDSDAQAH